MAKEKLIQIGNPGVEEFPIPSFDEDLLIKLCQDVAKIFEKEENIIHIQGDVIVVGDIHGSFHDLLRIIKHIESSNSKALFLGDYVDRGCFSLECITLLFTLKVLKPNQYYLLRGNHEFDAMCSIYGFKKEILNYHNPKKTDQASNNKTQAKKQNESDIDFDFDEVFDDEEEEEEEIRNQEDLCDDYFANHVNINCYKYTEKLYEAFIKAFSYIPICSIINNSSLCLHGGLTPLLNKKEDINQIKRPISNFDDDPLFSDIIWGDPSPLLPHFYSDNPRGRGKLFNGAVVVNFLKQNKLKRLIRAHECVKEGTEALFNDKCITVFSASSYSTDLGNSSGILSVNKKNDKIEFINFEPLHRLKKFDAVYYKVQNYQQNLENKSKFSVCNKRISEYKSGFFLSLRHINNARSDQNIKKYISNPDQELLLEETENIEKKGFSCQVFTNINVKGVKPRNAFVRKMPIFKSGPRRKITQSCSLNSQIHRAHLNGNQLLFQSKLAPLKEADDDDEDEYEN